MVFADYARYYDLLNQEKDYNRETEYICNLIRRHRSGARDILDLGCGSATHAVCLAQKGYRVVGVDRSEEQLRIAEEKINKSESLERVPELHCDDIRHLRLGRNFDVVVSLFHVMSYQTENADLIAAFQSARIHLRPGGLFLFDVWYGPSVLSLKPEPRLKRVCAADLEVVRIARPEMKVNLNCVDVHYDLLVCDKKLKKLDSIQEKHRMRYFFLPEVVFFLQYCGFKLLAAEEWLTGNGLDNCTWSGCFLAEATSPSKTEKAYHEK